MQGTLRFWCDPTGFNQFPSGYSAVAADLPVPAAVQRSVAKLLDLELGRATLDPAKQNRSRPKGVLPTEMVALACQGGARSNGLVLDGKIFTGNHGFSHELREVPVKIAPKKTKFHWKTKEVSPGKKGDFPGDPSKGETLRNFDRFVAFVCGPHIFSNPLPGKDKQDLLAAELQRQWQQRSLDLIKSLLERLEPVDGVVLMGGCALNVAANQFIQDSLKMEADHFLKHVFYFPCLFWIFLYDNSRWWFFFFPFYSIILDRFGKIWD